MLKTIAIFGWLLIGASAGFASFCVALAVFFVSVGAFEIAVRAASRRGGIGQ